jgi:hypothetical protein
MESWSARKEACVFCSDVKLRETVMSTMLPDEMLGGRRMEGNSICRKGNKEISFGLPVGGIEGVHSGRVWCGAVATGLGQSKA